MYIVNGCKCMTSVVVWGGGGVGNGERGGGGCLMSRGVSLEYRGTWIDMDWSAGFIYKWYKSINKYYQHAF